MKGEYQHSLSFNDNNTQNYNYFNNVLRNLASSHPYLILRLFKNPHIDSLEICSVYLFI
jgi:hypothetical protein